MQNTKTLAGKALRAMHQLLQILKEVDSPLNISFNLFDSLVASVLNYGAEVWGFMSAEGIERVHRKFCKYTGKKLKEATFQTHFLFLSHVQKLHDFFAKRRVFQVSKVPKC